MICLERKGKVLGQASNHRNLILIEKRNLEVN
jgi:hypothetical protein